MAFWNLAALQLEEFRPGIMSKAEIGDNLIMVCMQIGQGKEDTGHEHSFDQCGIVLEGRIEMFAGQERQMLTANECYFIPSGERHGWKTFDKPVKILDISLRRPNGRNQKCLTQRRKDTKIVDLLQDVNCNQ